MSKFLFLPEEFLYIPVQYSEEFLYIPVQYWSIYNFFYDISQYTKDYGTKSVAMNTVVNFTRLVIGFFLHYLSSSSINITNLPLFLFQLFFCCLHAPTNICLLIASVIFVVTLLPTSQLQTQSSSRLANAANAS